MHQCLVVQARPTVTSVEERVEPAKKMRCDDGVYRGPGDYDSSLDRHQDSSSGQEQSSSAIASVSVDASVLSVSATTAVVDTVETGSVVDESVAEKSAFPNVSLLSESQVAAMMDEPSELIVNITGPGDELPPTDC